MFSPLVSIDNTESWLWYSCRKMGSFEDPTTSWLYAFMSFLLSFQLAMQKHGLILRCNNVMIIHITCDSFGFIWQYIANELWNLGLTRIYIFSCILHVSTINNTCDDLRHYNVWCNKSPIFLLENLCTSCSSIIGSSSERTSSFLILSCRAFSLNNRKFTRVLGHRSAFSLDNFINLSFYINTHHCSLTWMLFLILQNLLCKNIRI